MNLKKAQMALLLLGFENFLDRENTFIREVGHKKISVFYESSPNYFSIRVNNLVRDDVYKVGSADALKEKLLELINEP